MKGTLRIRFCQNIYFVSRRKNSCMWREIRRGRGGFRVAASAGASLMAGLGVGGRRGCECRGRGKDIYVVAEYLSLYISVSTRENFGYMDDEIKGKILRDELYTSITHLYIPFKKHR